LSPIWRLSCLVSSLALSSLSACIKPALLASRPVVETVTGPLYGFWGLNGLWTPKGLADLHARTGMTVFQVACSDPDWCMEFLLPVVRDAGMHLTLRLTTDHPKYTTDGDFDLDLWQAQLQRWRGSGLQAFVADGTLVGHMLIDDIGTFSGRGPDGDDLDEMARTSRELFPDLMTYVRQQATRMPVPTGGAYRWLDACVNQYEASDGDVEDYLARQIVAGRALDLGMIEGLNIADGGDGSSGQAGMRPGHWAMSAQEIAHNGSVMARAPGMALFLAWEYDAKQRWSDGRIGAEYFRQPDLERALYQLGQQIAAQPPVGLHRQAPGPRLDPSPAR